MCADLKNNVLKTFQNNSVYNYSGENSVLYNNPLGLLIYSLDWQMHFDQINKENDFPSANFLHKRQEALCYAIFIESKTRTQAML